MFQKTKLIRENKPETLRRSSLLLLNCAYSTTQSKLIVRIHVVLEYSNACSRDKLVDSIIFNTFEFHPMLYCNPSRQDIPEIAKKNIQKRRLKKFCSVKLKQSTVDSNRIPC